MGLRSDAPGRVRLRRRLGVGTGLLAILSALFLAFAPGTALAVTPTEPCPNFQPHDYGNAHFVSWDNVNGSFRQVLTVFYFLEPPVETFNVAESAAVFNQLPTASQATFTSSTARTFTITTSQTLTTSVSNMLGVTFQNSVSQSITNSTTTTIGFSTTVQVPPNSRVQGDFGVRAFILHYNMARWELGGGRCWWRPEMGRQDVFTNAPTNIQEWRTHPQ
jgi:hypothetical protein